MNTKTKEWINICCSIDRNVKYSWNLRQKYCGSLNLLASNNKYKCHRSQSAYIFYCLRKYNNKTIYPLGKMAFAFSTIDQMFTKDANKNIVYDYVWTVNHYHPYFIGEITQIVKSHTKKRSRRNLKHTITRIHR